ncbi:MAG: hypothetical protein K9L28_10200 [Synergistales bacterium]|nr:hypothetical protein [Synergistales bacterium]
MRLFTGGTVVTGDGTTVLEGATVVVAGEYIAEVTERVDPALEAYAEEVVDCTGKCVMPGMINHHQHGVTFGPMFAGGCENYGREFVLAHLDRSLLQGHTTFMNVDGFATMEEVRETQRHHPIRIKTATTHTPLNIEAADLCDGGGLADRHPRITVEEMLAEGAVCIGEVGGGHTLGGGGQDYLYIPRAVKERTGREITCLQARAMMVAVLGRYCDAGHYNRQRVARTLEENGLDSLLTPEEARDIICATTVPQNMDKHDNAHTSPERYW